MKYSARITENGAELCQSAKVNISFINNTICNVYGDNINFSFSKIATFKVGSNNQMFIK